MKNHWKMLKLSILLLIIVGNILPMQAEKKDNLDEMSYAELLNSVKLGKYSDLVQKFQESEAKNVLAKEKVFGTNGKGNIEFIRNHEVIVVTIPASELFGPNKTELLDNANKYLVPFKRYFKQPDMYRVLAVMHTDNTGSKAYREDLTVKRAEAIADWFENSGVDMTYFFPFAMADDVPLPEVNNDSYENRAKNRRLEIILVPGEGMLEKAKKGKIAY